MRITRMYLEKVGNFRFKEVVFVVFFMFGFVTVSMASDSGDSKDELIQKLMTRVDQLENKVEGLTDKLEAYEQKPAAVVSDEAVEKKVDEIMAQKEEKSSSMISMPKISGFLDTTYNSNFNKPNSQTTKLGTPGAAVTGTEANLSSYIRKANEITFNTAHVALNGSLKDGIGYTIEFDVGSDANVNTPSGAGAADDFDLQEAYLTSPLFDTGVNLKVGKFVTLEGIEVIESPLNPTISRGYLFGMAEPFTNVGFLLSRALPIEGLELRAGLVNGWDLLSDNNTGKTFLGGLGINYGDLATGGLSIYYGPEQTANDRNRRTSIDLTIFNKSIPKLTLALQGNWGKEEGISGKTDSWNGFGIQPVYQLTDKFSLGGRIEYMDNKLGSRFGFGSGSKGGNLTNFTITPTYRLNDTVTTRLEFRRDVANNSFFEGEDGVFDEKSTNQVLAEVFYTF